jgi:NAD(P)-dependent dehydrogenase (short-subunit alcohol dehydrogenase family)
MACSGDPLFGVEGRAILVAGGAGGLGLPLAHALAARRARLTIADIDAEAARRLTDELVAEGAEAASIGLNVCDSGSCTAAVAAATERWGRLDGLLNASGIYRIAPALELAEDAFEDTIAINLTGAFRLAREAGRVMVGQRAGAIVTIASVSSAVANPHYAAYAASKAGVAHLSRVLALEWAPHGVTVNAIGPAATPTPLARPIFDDETRRQAALARIPMGRFGTPDDLIGATVFLLSPAAAFLTGQVLYVDGGRTIS